MRTAAVRLRFVRFLRVLAMVLVALGGMEAVTPDWAGGNVWYGLVTAAFGGLTWLGANHYLKMYGGRG